MALESAELVPSSEVCSDLVAAMARLIGQQGFDVFVSEPIYVPSATHFPEPLRATTGSVRTLIRRLMAYALLEELDVSLEVYDSANPYDEIDDDGRLLRPPHHAAAWYAGTKNGVCQFGLDARQLDDIEKLAGVLCHEVAHAFRDFHGIQVPTKEVEEMLTDLTTVYLGFGIFTANNAYRYRSEGSITGYMASHSWREEKIGYLSPQALVFLLALQVAARGEREKKRVRRQLELTQSKMFGAAMELIADHPELLKDLGLPPQEEWPSETKGASVAKAVTATLKRLSDDEPDEPIQIEELETPPESVPTVFMVYEDDSYFLTIFGAVVGTAVGGLLHEVIGAGVFVLAVLCALLGRALGKRLVRRTCSDPDCHAKLKAEARTCHGCGAIVEDNAPEEES